MNSSPERGTFQIDTQLNLVKKGEKTLEEVQGTIDIYKSWRQQRDELEQSDEWKIDNMEYDLRSTQWICDKAKENYHYAQNLYAAMCNNEFVKNDVWPILTDKRWSCSWRSAGGIVANMIEEGDYIDWYCSGISIDLSDEEFDKMTEEEKQNFSLRKSLTSPEGVVTDEIREDLLKLGWIVVVDNK